ncbi:MAG: HD domain-containing protein [Lachnospiraceae bacterium]|nr:HD domain-containing protein [Lachnospiraceae bacterium]
MEKDEIIKSAIKYVKDLFENNSDGHDVAHTMRVYKNALEITKVYPEADSFIVSLAALLHDADDHKLFITENNANARKFMANAGLSEDVADGVCKVINSVSFSKNRGKKPESLEGMIVQDADRLDALGAIGIARTFAYGGKNGRSLDMSLQHFYDKLFLLKDEINTDAAKKIAEHRHVFMKDYVNEYLEETGQE